MVGVESTPGRETDLYDDDEPDKFWCRIEDLLDEAERKGAEVQAKHASDPAAARQASELSTTYQRLGLGSEIPVFDLDMAHQALDLALRANKLHSNMPEAWFYLGLAQSACNHNNAAEIAFKKAKELQKRTGCYPVHPDLIQKERTKLTVHVEIANRDKYGPRTVDRLQTAVKSTHQPSQQEQQQSASLDSVSPKIGVAWPEARQ